MKKRFFVLGVAVLLSFGLVLASCDNGPPVATIFNLVANATADTSSEKSALSITITENSGRSARAIDLPNGSFPYIVEFGGVTISEGTVTVAGENYTFTPNGGGSEFSFDEGSGLGTITLNTAVKAQIVAAAGGLPVIPPNSFTMNSIMEVRTGGGYWDGTYCAKEDGYDMHSDFLPGPKITFSGSTYTLKDVDGDTIETGTFIYTAIDLGDPDCLFIFSRNNMTPQMAVYYYEGSNEPVRHYDLDPITFEELETYTEDPPNFSLYNWMYDPLEMSFDAVGFLVKE